MAIKPHKFFFAYEIFKEQIPNVTQNEVFEIIRNFDLRSYEVVDISCCLNDQSYLDDHPEESKKLRIIVDYLGLDENGCCYVCWDN